MNAINIDNIKSLQEALKKYVDNTRFINRNVQITLRMDFTEALINEVDELEERIAIMQESMEALEKRLDDSDRINVVRCSECQYWNPPTYAEQEDGSTVGHCTAALNGQQTDAYWFCADGTR